MDNNSNIIPLETWEKMTPLIKSGVMPAPFIQELFLMECDIAGTGYVDGIEKICDSLPEEAILTFVREPKNPHDVFAIRIDSANGEKLGYVPRRKNEVLARLMDGGKLLYGKILKKEIVNDWVNIRIKVFMRDL